MIRFKNVTKQFGNSIALDDINLEIEGEEFVVLVGPSAAGKSTLLHLLIGAEKPTGGSIHVDNFDIGKMTSKELAKFRQKIGFLFQDHKLLPKKTVYENVAFPLEILNFHDGYINARVIEVLHTVGMKGKEKKFPHELSGGEKQKVSLARAIAANPHLIIADEPTGNLDPDSTDDLVKLLLKINKNGTTVILATHNTKVVDDIQKRVVKLKEGKIVSDKAKGYFRS